MRRERARSSVGNVRVNIRRASRCRRASRHRASRRYRYCARRAQHAPTCARGFPGRVGLLRPEP